MSNTKKIKAGLVLQDPSEFIGHAGTIFYNPDTGAMYLSDGETPGGISLGSGGGGGFSGNYNDLSHKPTFATVATTGSYTDLTNTPSFATQSYVNNAIGNLINGAPSALNTLSELATALGNSTSFASTVTNSLANKVEASALSDVAFSGSFNDLIDTPTIPSLDGLATETFVTSRGYINSSALSTTLTNYATKTYVTTQGYITSGTLTGYGYLTSGDLSGYALTSDIPTLPDQTSHTGQFLKTDGADLYWDNAGLSYNDLSDQPTIPTLPVSANGYLRSTNEGVLSWDTPTISSLVDGSVTNSSIVWEGGTGSSLVDQPEFDTVSLITNQGGDTDHFFNFRYDGILQVPGQIYDVNGNPVIDREAKFEYKQFEDFNADINKRYIVRTQDNPVTVTLPSSQSLAGGEAIFFADAYNTFSVENPLIITGGYIGDSTSDTYVMSTPGSYIGIFNTGNGVWRIYSQGAQDPVTGGSSFSGDYNDLSNTPDLSGYVTGTPWTSEGYITSSDLPDLSGYVTGTPWNDQGFITSADLPSVPTSLGDLGITAGSDGQVLTLNSSLDPVWTTPSSGSTDRLVNGDYSFILDIHGAIVATNGSIGPTSAGEFGFGADAGANAVIKANGGFSTWIFRTDNILQLPGGGDIVNSDGMSVLGGGASTGNITFSDTSISSTNGDIVIGFEPSASPAVYFSFTENGVFTAPSIQTGVIEVNGATINTTGMIECLPNMDTVVYTNINLLASTIKALFHVEGTEQGTSVYEAQSCEMMVARMSNRVTGSVYGLAYTSTSPLATFNARYNSQADIVEITCRPASTTDSVYVQTNATEMLTTP